MYREYSKKAEAKFSKNFSIFKTKVKASIGHGGAIRLVTLLARLKIFCSIYISSCGDIGYSIRLIMHDKCFAFVNLNWSTCLLTTRIFIRKKFLENEAQIAKILRKY